MSLFKVKRRKLKRLFLKKENKYIRILLWAYQKKQDGFTLKELEKDFNLDARENEYIRKVFLTTNGADRKFFEQLGSDTQKYILNEKGISAVLSYLDQRETEHLSKFAALVSILALFIAIYTTMLTKNSVELAADPIISITPAKNDTLQNEVLLESGEIRTKDSILKLILTNNSLSTIEDVDIRMTLWKIYINNDHKLTVCALGYVDHADNPNFVIPEDLRGDNILNKTFSLAKNEEYPISVDFSDLEYLNSQILLRISVNYVKSVSQANYNYIKLYSLTGYSRIKDPSQHSVVDVDLAPEYVRLNHKGEEVYPFFEKEFIEYFERPKPNLMLNGCDSFSVERAEKVIIY